MAYYTFHEDPSHAWLEVSRSELNRLGILDQITSFSYQRGDAAFLEEDRDATTFAAAKQAVGEWPIDTIPAYLNRDHWIRNLQPFSASKGRTFTKDKR